MAEKDNTFQNTVEALFRGMDSFITTKTVVGEAIHIDDTILLPLVDVSFGVGAGAFAENAKNNAGGGMGGKISPSAVLVISKNGTRLVNIKNQDAVTKIIDMAPDLISRFTDKKEEDGYTAEKVEHIINQEGRASHQPDDPQLISYGSCGRSAAVRGISSVLQYRGIVKDAQKDRK